MIGLAIGRIVHYVLTVDDCDQINRRRDDAKEIHERMSLGKWNPGAQAHVGSIVYPGDHVPAVIVHIWSPDGNVNLKCLLDGNDDFWAQQRPNETTATVSKDNRMGTWHWPENA